LTFKYDSEDVVDFLKRNTDTPNPPGYPKQDWTRAVDGRRRIKILKQLPVSSAGRSWEVRSRVVGIYDKGVGKGTVMERVHDLVDAETGQVYTSSWENCFFLGAGGWGGDRGLFPRPSISKISNYSYMEGPRINEYPPPASRTPDTVRILQTTLETAHLYRLNGDYNPLHASPEAGKRLGYGGIIIHGLFSWNVAAQVVLQHYGRSNGKALRDFEARFTSPVCPGDTLNIQLWDMGLVEGSTGIDEDCCLNEIRFNIKVGNRTVLSNGRALLETRQNSAKL
jgi:peroxisomal enoyl-CoA hydratase 2